jgi:branched-chain amino acid transport system permease protein
MKRAVRASRQGLLQRASGLRSWGIFGVAAVAATVIALTGNGYQTQLLFSTCMFIVLAYAWNIISGLGGYVSFGQIGFFGIGAYVATMCQIQLQADWYVAAILAGLAAAVLAIPLGTVMLRLQGIFFALGMFGLTRIGALIAESSPALGGDQGESVPLVGTPQQSSLVMLAVACATVVLAWWILHSRLGLQLMAVRDDELAAAASGVNTNAAKLIAFCLSAGPAAVAGGLFIWNIGFINPGSTFNGSYELQTVLMVLIGGIGTQWGPFFGAVLVSIIGESLWARFPEQQQIIVGALTAIAIVWMPGGIVSVLNRFGWLRRQPIWGPPAAMAQRPDVGLLPAPPPKVEHASKAVLRCEQLSKRFGGVIAVQRLDMEVEAGQILAVIGPNGAGKTTLFNLMTGFDRPSGGNVWFLGRNITRRAPYRIARAGLARTFQTSRPFPSLTAWETLLLPAVVRTRARSQSIAAAARMLYQLGLDQQWDRSPDMLPAGQQRLLDIGRALMLHPRVLLLDEAMAGMSAAEIAHVHALLSAAIKQGCAIVAIEHVLPAIMTIADYVQVLDFGATIARGTPSEVLHNPAVVDAYLGTGEEAAVHA